ncbi:MAG: hypothetical protein A2V88_16440 [Elusimicrobia bacterium RBG_16_66_12]|nr:MAG: hypothetical protein A2V88_16440 [Elusimicrobia bacterium RBG_16_66_12]
MKFFTVSEAEAVIPSLEGIFEAVAELTAQAEVKTASLRRLQEDDSDPAAAVIERSQLQFLAAGINEWMQKIVDLGAVPKGVQPALVDFPSHLEGREVYLCWKLGDKRLTHYHGTNEGFADRKPLPKRRR